MQYYRRHSEKREMTNEISKDCSQNEGNRDVESRYYELERRFRETNRGLCKEA